MEMEQQIRTYIEHYLNEDGTIDRNALLASVEVDDAFPPVAIKACNIDDDGSHAMMAAPQPVTLESATAAVVRRLGEQWIIRNICQDMNYCENRNYLSRHELVDHIVKLALAIADAQVFDGAGSIAYGAVLLCLNVLDDICGCNAA